MMLALIFAVGLPVLVLVVWLLRLLGRDATACLAAAGLGAGLGTGLAAAVFLAWRFVAPSHLFHLFPALDGVLWTVAGLAALVVPVAAAGSSRRWSPEARRLTWAFVGIFGLSLTLFLLRSLRQPHGEWDAWAIWNLKARFMAHGGEHWRDLFSAAITHPGYPLLVPAAVARLWSWIGAQPAVAGVAVAGIFTYAIPAVVVGSLARIKGWTPALWGGLLVLASISMTRYGSWQVADVPFGFFILAAVVLVAFDIASERPWRFSVLAGLAVGLGCLAKNEGQPFAIGMTVAYVAYQLILRRSSHRDRLIRIAAFILATLPFLGLLMLIHAASPSVGLASAFSDDLAMNKVTDVERHLMIGRAFLRTLWRWSGVWFLGAAPVFIAALFLGGVSSNHSNRVAAGFGAVAIGLMFISYYAAYLVSPYDLAWHIPSSLDRILVHIWPTFVWTFCLAVSFEPRRSSTIPRAVD